MASSDATPRSTPVVEGSGPTPPGQPLTTTSQLIDTGAKMLQSMKPVQQIRQHACSFALYGHDPTRQIEIHHYISRLNQDFLQCAVYDSGKSKDSKPNLLGVEYILSERVFETLPPEEQKLWHSHAYEIKSGLWVHPGMGEMIVKPEVKALVKTYGKFWCTWQVDRGDGLPLGAPALMMSPQGVNAGAVRPELVKRRDDEYKVAADELKAARAEIEEPEWINPNADYWKQHGMGFALDVVEAEMKRCAPFP